MRIDEKVVAEEPEEDAWQEDEQEEKEEECYGHDGGRFRRMPAARAFSALTLSLRALLHSRRPA